MTPGRPYSSDRKRKPFSPVTVATWPGQRKPSIAKSSIASSARRAGSTDFSMESSVKFFSPRSFAARTAAAVPGAVVSNPMPRKTTCFPDSSSAMARASIGEYTMRTSAPRARRRSRLSPLRLPGTRSMSPYPVSITSGSMASSSTASRSSCTVTQTGQPGPESR